MINMFQYFTFRMSKEIEFMISSVFLIEIKTKQKNNNKNLNYNKLK